jgi:homoserine O-acetyltransferase
MVKEPIETKFFNFEELKLESGEKLSPVTLAYEAYGKLNTDKSNAILIVHALSGDAHAAGPNGWWEKLIGVGKAFDTGKYFIICSNVLGGCRGSTGPASLDPKTGKPYGLDFPIITISDMVNAQKKLIDFLGIDKLLSVAGGSMGGMQVLEWLVSYPEQVVSAIPIATAVRHSPQQIAFDEVGRQAIMADINWNDGNYYGGPAPDRGLAVARMVGHITYMSDQSMEDKFGRKFRDKKQLLRKFAAEFEVEGYLQYRGDSFVKRFDANSYLYITKAMDYFDAFHGKSISEAFRGIKAKVLVLAFKSDWLYPAYQSQEIVKACKLAGIGTVYCEIDSKYGHDSFLVEIEEETHLIRNFLKNVKVD